VSRPTSRTGRATVAVAASAASRPEIRVVNRDTDTSARFFGELGMTVPAALEAIDNPTQVGAVDVSTERLDLVRPVLASVAAAPPAA